MWIKESGALGESVVQLSTVIGSHYLIVGAGVALVDSGVDAITPRLISEIERCLGADAVLDFVFVTHAHFDHVGGIPALRKRWPNLEVFGAPATAQLLSNPDQKKLLWEKNLDCCKAFGVEPNISESEFSEGVKIERIVGDGDVIEMGGDVEVKLIACPGHTEDSVAYFVKPDQALIGGESVGSYRGRDQMTPCFSSNYTQYMESLDKLSALEIRILGTPHSGALTGELVSKYFTQSKGEAEQFCKQVKERIEQGELVDEICGSILPDWRAQNICPEGPFVAEQESVLLAMIRAAAAA